MQGVSVAAYLGRLVEAEVARRRDGTIAGVSLELGKADQALVALSEVRASIDELDGIAGRLARSATAHGASWEDVGSSLRVSADAPARLLASSRDDRLRSSVEELAQLPRVRPVEALERGPLTGLQLAHLCVVLRHELLLAALRLRTR